MSAISGVVNFKEKEVNDRAATDFGACFSSYKVDKIDGINHQNVSFWCAYQNFTGADRLEKLPFCDEEKNLIFTADCVLDNREELCGWLEIANDIPDGEIIYKSYLKWGMGCLSKLRGVFSFAIYDYRNNELILAVDHFAQRCLYYHVRDGKAYFSTLLFPLMEATGLQFEENERWLVDCISLRSPAMMIEPLETPLKDVYKVVSGTYIRIGCDGIPKETRYYNPSEIPTDRSITPKQSEEMMRDAMQKVVSRIISSDVNYACQLSAGLDSSTVACIAAKELAKSGKTLRSYTSVPLKEANLPTRGYNLYDESEGVKTICRYYPNIVPTFVDTQDRNYLREVDKILKIWEMPCKSQQNAIWIDEIIKQAAADGCKIMLAGSTGNCTLSAGDLSDLVFDRIKKFRVIEAYKLMDAVKKVGGSRKKYAKGIFKNVKSYFGWYFDSEGKNIYSDIATDEELGEKYRVKERFNKEILHRFPYKNIKKYRTQMYMPSANAQIGEIDTKYSLEHGVLIRDPMRTPEIVELCHRLPLECFANKDYDRRLVREGMRGIVPEEIRHDIAHRGKQSGDNMYRLSLAWDEVRTDMVKSLYDDKTLKYLSEKKLKKFMDAIEVENIANNKNEVTVLVDAYVFAKYLEKVNCKM